MFCENVNCHQQLWYGFVQTGDDCTNFCHFVASVWPVGCTQAFRNEWEGQTLPSGNQTLQWVWQWEILEVMEV